MSETVNVVENDVDVADNSEYFAEFDKYMQDKIKTREELEAEAVAQQQRYLKLRNEFNQTDIGKKLVRLRDDDYVRVAFQRLMEEMQKDSTWFREMMGGITDVLFAEDPRYQALNEYYEKNLEQYIKSQTRAT